MNRWRFSVLLVALVALLSSLASASCCHKIQPFGWWGEIDYLLLWRKQRRFPPLVTSNPNVPPILSAPDTTIVFGDEELGRSPHSGGKVDGGIWLTPWWGVGIGAFGLSEEKICFHLQGDPLGVPTLGRPFFNTLTGMEDVDVFSGPGIFGNIDIESVNRFWGFDLYAKYKLFSFSCLQLDLLGGFLYERIDDQLTISTSEEIFLLPPFQVQVSDHFDCRNDYYAGLFGARLEWRSSCWAVMATGKVGLGNMAKTVEIWGMTRTFSIPGPEMIVDSGLLAQPSNSGKHFNHHFEIVPEGSVQLQLRLLPHIWLTAGYTYLFWPAIALAGEQVNLNINPTQNPGPVIGDPSPLFRLKNTSFWAHGLTAGIYVLF